MFVMFFNGKESIQSVHFLAVLYSIYLITLNYYDLILAVSLRLNVVKWNYFVTILFRT